MAKRGERGKEGQRDGGSKRSSLAIREVVAISLWKSFQLAIQMEPQAVLLALDVGAEVYIVLFHGSPILCFHLADRFLALSYIRIPYACLLRYTESK